MNKMSQANVIKLSIVLTIGAIFAILAVIFIKNKEEQNNKEEENIILKEFTIVDNYQLYFFVSKNMNNYITANSDTAILALMDSKYVGSNNITLENIADFKKYNNEDYEFKIKELYSRQNDTSFTIYYLTGDVIDTYLSEVVKADLKFVVYVDYNNATYSVVPIDDIEKVEDYKNPEGDLSIKNNGYNKFESVGMIDSNQICMIYLSDYIMLDDNKKMEITTNIDDKNEFKNINFNSTVKSCAFNKDSRVYTVMDNNNNRYRFAEESIMNYTVTINN